MTQSLTLGDHPQEDKIADAAVYKLTPETLEAIWQELFDVECRGSGEKAFDEEMFRGLLSNPKAILVLMRSLADNKLIGYTLANPDEDEEDGKTSYIESTAIVPEFQGKKLVALLIDKLEEEMRNQGYEYMTRDSMEDNGYAAKISKLEGPSGRNRIVEEQQEDDPHGLGYGLQRHFKLDIRNKVGNLLASPQLPQVELDTTGQSRKTGHAI